MKKMTLEAWAKKQPYRIARHGDNWVIPDGQELVDRSEAWRLSDYLVSSVAGGSIWFAKRTSENPTREDLEEKLESLGSDYDKVISMIEDVVHDLADAHAAEAWSTPGDELTDMFGEDVWVMASFGSRVAINGDLVDKMSSAPKGYELTRQGGEIPVVEEEVSVEFALREVARVEKLPVALVTEVAASAKFKELAYVSVSGEAEIWAKKGK